MLNYLTRYGKEFIKKIQLSEAEQDDQSIVRILDVTKKNGVVTQKEVWPNQPTKLRLISNYDLAKDTKTRPDNVYQAPVVNPANRRFVPIQVTVIPYPEDAKWKLTHSSNYNHNSVFDRIYSGTKTITIPFGTTVEEGTEEFAWIKAVPASGDSVSDESMFGFWIRMGKVQEESDTENGPALYWSFDDAENPLLDSVQGKSLKYYRNTTKPESHITDDASGAIDCGLSNYYQDPDRCIYVDDDVFVRNSNLDQSDENATMAWYNSELGIACYTSGTSFPTAGAAVYDETGTPTGSVVKDCFESEPNTFLCDNAGFDVSNIDTECSILTYVHPSTIAKIGFLNNLYIETGAKDSKPVIYYNSNNHISCTDRMSLNTAGWAAVGAFYTKRYMVEDNPYSKEKGYGFIADYGYLLSWGNAGNISVYLRDPDKDANGKYAWTYTYFNGLIRNQPSSLPSNTWSEETGAEQAPSTFWTDSETISTTQIRVTSDGELHAKARAYSMYYRLVYIDFRYPWSVAEIPSDMTIEAPDWATAYPFVHTRWNTNNNTDPPSKYVTSIRLYGGYVNGKLSAVKESAGNPETSALGDIFRVSIPTTNRNIQMGNKSCIIVDEIQVYDRVLSAEEFNDHAATIGIGTGTSTKKPELKCEYFKTYGSKKITAQDDSVYYYDPDYTRWLPQEVFGYAFGGYLYYGWSKLSGTGPDHIYTGVIEPEAGAIYTYEADPTVNVPSTQKIKTVADLKVTEAVLDLPFIVRIIDNQTLAVSVLTHDCIVNKMRVYLPDTEAVTYNSENGYLRSYNIGFTQNCAIWRTHNIYQPEIRRRVDDESLWDVDGNPITIQDRWWTSMGLFYVNQLQYRNATPDNPWYASKAEYAGDAAVADFTHIAYIRLSQPMQEGSTHTVHFGRNSCTFTYDSKKYCATIKVNQEGYIPWAGKKYAYVGRWMGGTPYTIANPSSTHFYIVPSAHPDIEHAVFSGTLTQRCIAGTNNGLCKDRYGLGAYPEHPLTGENVYECDFSNLTTVRKNMIATANGVYERDVLEDWVDGTITVLVDPEAAAVQYRRAREKDTCNAYAWYNASADPQIVYTDTHIPTTEETARAGYDDTVNHFTITAVTTQQMYGWSIIRSKGENEDVFDYLEDAWKTRHVGWTTAETPSSGTFYKEDGTTDSIHRFDEDMETHDISGMYHVYIPGLGWSFEFPISGQAIGHQFWVNMRGMFHQRSGCPNVRHPYTNWEYFGPGHPFVYDGGFPWSGDQAKDTSAVWEVDATTHETIYAENDARVQLSGSGTVFGMNGDQDKLATQPMYDVYGGWFDAADFDMREFHMDCFGLMAEAYILEPDKFTDNQLDIPESGDGIPDILSEALWGAELYRKAQEKTGAIRGWFESSGHESDWPWLSTKKYYACAPSMKHSIMYTANAGRLAKALRIAATKVSNPEAAKRCEHLANVYLESAIAAFKYGCKDQSAPYIKIPDDERAPVYITCKNRCWAYLEWCDTFENANDISTSKFKEFGMRQYNGACVLYDLTREDRFLKYITGKVGNRTATEIMRASWINVINDNHRFLPYDIMTMADVLPDDYNTIKSAVISVADTNVSRMAMDPYRMLNWGPGNGNMKFQGFGLCHPETRGCAVMMAWYATHDKKYRDCVINAFDHITGCNNMGACWTIGMGHIHPGRHLDHWVTRNALWNDIWTPRPGITTYRIYEPYWPSYKASDKTVPVAYEGRSDHYCPPIKINMVPAVCTRKYGMTWSNCKELWARMIPLWTWEPITEVEGIQVGASEYTVWETMIGKCFITACLIGEGWKPRTYYKQVAPKKTIMANAEILAMIP